MTDPDPRIEAVAKAVYDREAASATPWARLASQAADEWRAEAIPLLAAADAVDPLRVSLPPNPRQTRAGIAPAGTPTKRIWPEP